MSQISADLFTRSVRDKTDSDKLAVHISPGIVSSALHSPSVFFKDFEGLYHELNAVYKTKLIDKHLADLRKMYTNYAREGLPVDGIERKIRAIEKTKPATFVGRDVKEFADKNFLPHVDYKEKPWEIEFPTAVELWEKAKRIKPTYDRYGYQNSWTNPRVAFLNEYKYGLLPGPRRKLPG